VAQNRQTGGANQQNRQTSQTQNQAQRQQSREAQTNTRQQGATNRQENRQNYGENAQQNRQDFANDNWDNYYRPGWGAAAVGVAAGAAVGYAGGAAASPTVITTLPCTPAPVVVGQVSYYPCNGTW
jgi:hypothetical protein